MTVAATFLYRRRGSAILCEDLAVDAEIGRMPISVASVPGGRTTGPAPSGQGAVC
jgi:hypothetical protein